MKMTLKLLKSPTEDVSKYSEQKSSKYGKCKTLYNFPSKRDKCTTHNNCLQSLFPQIILCKATDNFSVEDNEDKYCQEMWHYT